VEGKGGRTGVWKDGEEAAGLGWSGVKWRCLGCVRWLGSEESRDGKGGQTESEIDARGRNGQRRWCWVRGPVARWRAGPGGDRGPPRGEALLSPRAHGIVRVAWRGEFGMVVAVTDPREEEEREGKRGRRERIIRRRRRRRGCARGVGMGRDEEEEARSAWRRRSGQWSSGGVIRGFRWGAPDGPHVGLEPIQTSSSATRTFGLGMYGGTAAYSADRVPEKQHSLRSTGTK
jgi:hypothetical protein